MDSPMRSIAVIDDDFRVLESLQNRLASSGYRSETYLSAEDFLESDGPSRSDCIVADVTCPR
jgi:FixJ family two-component response regulator